MGLRSKKAQERSALLDKIPEGAKLILVVTQVGEKKYRPLADLSDSDDIQVNKDGIPIVMKAQPGRSKNPKIEPLNATVAEILRRKQESVGADPIIAAARDKPDDPDVLQQVIVAFGEEAASIAFERQEAERKGEETSGLSLRRINALKALAETWMRRRDQLTARGIDLDSSAFKALFSFIMQTFKEAMLSCGVRGEMVETVFAKLAQMTNGEWENEAKNRMKNL
jgi:hypothetical protein